MNDRKKELVITPIDIPSALSLDELTTNHILFLRLFAASLEDNVDGSLPSLTDENLLELADSLAAQSNLIGVDGEGRVRVAASYDLTRPQGGFFEGIAVHPAARKLGYASIMASAVLERAKEAGLRTMVMRSQPSSLAANEHTLRRLGYSVETDRSQSYPRSVVYLD